MADLKPIDGFEDYLIAEDGEVYTAWKQRRIKPSLTREGAVKITLYNEGRPYTRSLALLVAKAHLYNDHDPDVFDTPIHLDNDLCHNHVRNLMWRPRWFAVKYQEQYWNVNYRTSRIAVVDVKREMVYDSVMDACQEFGLLFIDVLKSCNTGETVFPTWKIFQYVQHGNR